MIRVIAFFALASLASLAFAEVLLPPNSAKREDVTLFMRECYSTAMGPFGASGELFKGIDKDLLQGKSTRGFLYDGRPLRPRDDGAIAPRESLFNVLRSSARTDPFVSCLLVSGFKWESSKESGFEMFQRLAEQGNVRAQAEFARAYYFGLGVTRNNTLAFKWASSAANRNDADAQFLLSALYSEGDGTLPDDDAALQWLERAVAGGQPQAQRAREQLEKMIADRKRANQAEATKLSETKAAAESGNATAQRTLAGYYIEGIGVARDVAVALDWYRKAAQSGDIRSLVQLGVLHDKGRGVPVDYSEASKWYRLAAEKGDSQAQYNLGILLFFGAGAQRNQEEGREWVRRSAEQSNEMAIRALPSLR